MILISIACANCRMKIAYVLDEKDCTLCLWSRKLQFFGAVNEVVIGQHQSRSRWPREHNENNENKACTWTWRVSFITVVRLNITLTGLILTIISETMTKEYPFSLANKYKSHSVRARLKKWRHLTNVRLLLGPKIPRQLPCESTVVNC